MFQITFTYFLLLNKFKAFQFIQKVSTFWLLKMQRYIKNIHTTHEKLANGNDW